MATDIIIPLGSGSKKDNDELRILLRSMETNARNIGRVAIVTDNLPGWLQNVVHVNYGDVFDENKDGNMINKTIAAINQLQCQEFVLTCDDTVFNQPCDLDDLPILYNARTQDDFGPDFDAKKWKRWHRRMYHTYWLADEMGRPLAHNYETHTPQRYNAWLMQDLLKEVNYRTGVGYGIFTLFRLCEGRQNQGQDQTAYKTTHESEDTASAPMDKLYVGYNDKAFLHGLRKRLLERFPNKSRYER